MVLYCTYRNFVSDKEAGMLSIRYLSSVVLLDLRQQLGYLPHVSTIQGTNSCPYQRLGGWTGLGTLWETLNAQRIRSHALLG